MMTSLTFRPLLLPAAIALGLLIAGGSLSLAGRGSPGIIGDDDRQLIDSAGSPWSAIGQVNIGGYRAIGQCTGTLVRPDLVITAAHCVMNEAKSQPFPLRNIHFLAGVRGGERRGNADAKCLRFLKGYSYVAQRTANGVPLSAMFQDVVAIVLDRQIDVPPARMADSRTRETGQALVHAAYPVDQRFRLSAHVGCRLLQPNRPVPVWLTDCDTHPASSGGPVFVDEDGELRLAAVMVGAGARNSTAVPLAQWQDLLDGYRCD
jgi:protease YdgD